jgi:tol-pal system protein YbgF
VSFKEAIVKKRQMIYMLVAAMAAGGIGGTLFSPTVVRATDKYIIDLVSRTQEIQQTQKDTTTALTTNFAVLKTLIEQQADSNNKLSIALAGVQKSVQDMQANSGTRLETTATQISGLSDNLSDMQQRLSKINTQLADIQSNQQSLDAKVSALAQCSGTNSGGAPGTNPGGTSTPPAGGATTAPPTSSAPPASAPSAQNLYDSALHDILTKKYDLAQSEFQDYLKYYPKTDYASNAVFYLGEIAFVQGHFPEALDHYSDVIANFPQSFKLGAARYKRGVTYIALGKRQEGIADLRAVTHLFPKTDEDQAARNKLKELGVSVTAVGAR